MHANLARPSLGAAHEALAWILQGGHLRWLLGLDANGAVVTWPLYLFAVLFGLSMGYTCR